jgi:7-carboxy-7-deazaguanine synthase
MDEPVEVTTHSDMEDKFLPARRFPVVEIFGPTMQGEGAMSGTITHFVRFGGCDSRCNWCDSAYAVLPAQVKANSTLLTAIDIVAQVRTLVQGSADWVTLTGGNPALLQIDGVVMRLQEAGYKVNVETQGTVWKAWMQLVDLVTVSPKGPSSGNVVEVGYGTPIDRIVEDSHKVCIKVVIFDDDDYEYAKSVRRVYPTVDFWVQAGTYMGGLNGDFVGQGQPESLNNIRLDNTESLVRSWRDLAERVAREPIFRGCRVGVQQHAILWGHGRGF